MKIAIMGTLMPSNVEVFLGDAFTRLAHEVVFFDYRIQRSVLYGVPLSTVFMSLGPVRRRYDPRLWRFRNRRARDFLKRERPNLILCHNGAELDAETLRYVTKGLGAPAVSLVMDDPTVTWYLANYLAAIPYFSHLLVAERFLTHKLRFLTTNRIEYLSCGTNPECYHPLDDLLPSDAQFACELGYVSTAYGARPAGVYRGMVLRHVKEFGLKIFGDPEWRLIADKVPELAGCIHATGLLSPREMCALFTQCKIFMAIGHPQMISGVTQRIFDAAAAGAFQMTEAKSDVSELFPDQSVETFDSIGELREKVVYFLEHAEERKAKAKVARHRVLSEHTWVHKAQRILEIAFG